MNKSTKKRNNQMFIINNYMKNKKITSDLQYQIRHYLEYYWNESLSENTNREQQIINQLSNTLKENLMVEANRMLLETPFFRDNFSFKTILKTISIVTEQRCTPEEIIYLSGDTDEKCIYFIEKGSVQVFHTFENDDINSKCQINLRKQGDFFGEISFFTGLQRNNNYRSLEFTTLIKIDRAKFIDILLETPDDYERFCTIKDDIILNNNVLHTKRECVYCRDNPMLNSYHIESRCPLLHFIPNKQRIQDSFKYSCFQEQRVKQNRKKLTKFNTLGHIELVNGDQHRLYFTHVDLCEAYRQINRLYVRGSSSEEGDDDEESEGSQHNVQNEENKGKNKSTLTSNSLSNSFSSSSSSSDQSSKENLSVSNESYSSEKNLPPNSLKNISPLIFKSRTPKKSLDLPSLERGKGKVKASIIQEADQESEQDNSPVRSKKVSPKKILSQYKEDMGSENRRNRRINNISISAFNGDNEEDGDDDDEVVSEGSENDENISKPTSLITINQITPFLSTTMKEVNQKPRLLHSKSLAASKEYRNSLDVETKPPVKRNEYLFRSKSNDNNVIIKKIKQKSANISRKSSLNQKDGDFKDERKASRHNSLKKSQKQAGMSQSVKFTLPKKNFKHRNSKSMQEISQDREQLKLILQRNLSEKSINVSNSSLNSQNNKKQQHQQGVENSENKMKWMNSFRKQFEQTQYLPTNLNTFNNESHNHQNEHPKNEEWRQGALFNSVNQSLDNQRRFSEQLDNFMTNFKVIQDIIVNKSHENIHDPNKFNHRTYKIPHNPLFTSFEYMKSFAIYFPHNNYENVIAQYQRRLIPGKQKKVKYLQQIWKSGMVNIPSSSSLNVVSEQAGNNINSSNHNNIAAITDILGQSSINRLKILKSNTHIRKTSVNDSHFQSNIQSIIQKQQQESSPKNKLLGSPTQEEENSKTKISPQKKQEQQFDFKPESHLIPNYFGTNMENQSQSLPQKSRFGGRSSNFSRLVIEHETDNSQIENSTTQN